MDGPLTLFLVANDDRGNYSEPQSYGVHYVAYILGYLEWKERARLPQQACAPPTVLLEKIKTEARLWVIAGARCLGELLPRE